MQMGEVVELNLAGFTPESVSGHVECENYTRKQRILNRHTKRKRKSRYIKKRISWLCVIFLFFIIVCLAVSMLRFILRESFEDSSRIFDFGNISNVSETSDILGYHGISDYDWQLILVNKNNPVPYDYEVELTTLSNGVQVDSRIYPDLQKMFDDMRDKGIYPVVSEGYRSHEQQERMMQDKIDAFIAEGYSKKESKQMASKWVASPGTSEHEIGLALDINASDNSQTTHEEVYRWLYNNAYKYGFILRYPDGKESITGIDYEPWHYRYVGEKAAREIYESGLTLEEYYNSNVANK